MPYSSDYTSMANSEKEIDNLLYMLREDKEGLDVSL